MSPSMQRRVVLGATGVWLALIVLGMTVVIRYSLAPGQSGNAPAIWPASTLERPAGLYTMVLAAHPRCPCTRASLEELQLIMSRCQGRIGARVLFVQPEGFTDTWARSVLWRQAATIPGVQSVLDPGGIEARRFGAFTSGQVALYDPDGRLVFSGGITGARGQAGPSAGVDAILAQIGNQSPTSIQFSVFGCPLNGPPSTHPSKRQACPDS